MRRRLLMKGSLAGRPGNQTRQSTSLCGKQRHFRCPNTTKRVRRRPNMSHGPVRAACDALGRKKTCSGLARYAPHRCGRDVALTRQRLDAEVRADAPAMPAPATPRFGFRKCRSRALSRCEADDMLMGITLEPDTTANRHWTVMLYSFTAEAPDARTLSLGHVKPIDTRAEVVRLRAIVFQGASDRRFKAFWNASPGFDSDSPDFPIDFAQHHSSSAIEQVECCFDVISPTYLGEAFCYHVHVCDSLSYAVVRGFQARAARRGSSPPGGFVLECDG